MTTTEQLYQEWHKAEAHLTQIHAENGGGYYRSPQSICLHRAAGEAMSAYMASPAAKIGVVRCYPVSLSRVRYWFRVVGVE